jgi:hypothetical protein
MAEEDNFLSRWSRRKAQVRQGGAAEAAPPVAPSPGPPSAAGERKHEVARADSTGSTPSLAPVERGTEGEGAPPQVAPPPLPTLADVALLGRDSDYTRFVAPGVDESVKRAAMKKMFFSDPHFNVMDGLDIYIGDYNTPDPIPPSMLRQMWQSKALGLFDDEEEAAKAPQLATTAQASPDGAAPAPLSQSPTEPAVPLDENPDLRLQPDDDPGRPGPDEGAGPASV